MTRKRIIVVLVILVLCFLAYRWYQAKKAYRGIFERPEFAKIERGNLVIPISATGSVEPAHRIQIKPKASGTVRRVYCEPGDIVRQGDLLVELDPKDEKRAVRNAQADVLRAQAELGWAEKNREKLARDWPVGLMFALANLERARASLHHNVVKFNEAEALRVGGSRDKAPLLVVRPEDVTPEQLHPEDHPLVKDCALQIALAEEEAARAGGMVTKGRSILETSQASGAWQSLSISQTEYRTVVSTLWQSKANLLASSADVRNAVNNYLLIKQWDEKVESTRALLKKAKVAWEQAEQRLEETRIYAPTDGIIEQVFVREGQNVSSAITTVTGGTPLMILADASKLYVIAEVDEADIGSVRDLAPPARASRLHDLVGGAATRPTTRSSVGSDEYAEMLKGAGDVKITVDAFREQPFWGKVDRVDPHPNVISNVVTYKVNILLTSANRSELMLGMHANVEFTAQKRENVLLVDIEAIKVKNDEHGVYIAGEDGKPQFVPVTLGPNNGERIELRTDKLEEGKKVYTKLPRKTEKEKKAEEEEEKEDEEG